MTESAKNQRKYFGIESEQLNEIISIGKQYTDSYKILGNGWGGNVLFICEKNKAPKLVEDLISDFYLNEKNKILLSDDV